MTVTSVAKKALLLSFLLLLFLIYMFLLSQVPFLSCSSSDYQQAFLLIDLTHSATEKDPFFFFFILMEKLAHRNTLLALCCRQE